MSHPLGKIPVRAPELVGKERLPAAGAESLPGTELAAAKGLCLPSGGALTDDEIDRVVDTYVACRAGLLRRAT